MRVAHYNKSHHQDKSCIVLYFKGPSHMTHMTGQKGGPVYTAHCPDPRSLPRGQTSFEQSSPRIHTTRSTGSGKSEACSKLKFFTFRCLHFRCLPYKIKVIFVSLSNNPGRSRSHMERLTFCSNHFSTLLVNKTAIHVEKLYGI